jgi:HK97 family phage prohead protease
MKTKSLKSEVVDIAEKGIVTIAISRFGNRDSYDDIVRKGAFSKTFQEGSGRIKHVMDHQLRQMAVVGLPMKMYETDTHAIVESALNLEKQIARDLFSDYKFFKEHGKTLEHSYMYDTIKTNDNKEIKGEDIAELRMYEYSTVALGANPDTPLLDIKSFTFSDLKALEEYLGKYDVSDEKAKQVEEIIRLVKLLKEPGTSTPVHEPVTLADPSINLLLKRRDNIKQLRK